MMTLTIVRLLEPAVDVLARELDERVREAPELFRNLPVILDVEAVAASDLYLDLPGLAALLRTKDFVPVGIRGGGEHWAEAAASAGLAVFPAERESSSPRVETEVAAPEASAPPVERNGGMLVTQPVRSGQQIYSRGGDLVILAPVSPGAEVLADGHIHVYSTLNGRALAGVQGDAHARIFCQSLRADLVSIAGMYSLSEQFDEELIGQPVQVSLRDDTLRFERL